jgi:hypothetical protein
VTVSAGELTRFATDIFARAGLPRADAGVVAEVLVWANLRGVDTHGVMRVPRYIDLIENGDMNPEPAIRIRTETPASVLIEADRAAGPVAMMRAVSEAVRKARGAGVGLALVRATTHTAALGYYTLAIARERMAGIALAGSWPNVVYHGARAAGVSTSPISIAVPGGEPVVLDMATSLVSMGKLNQAKAGLSTARATRPRIRKQHRLRCPWRAPRVRGCPSWSSASRALSHRTLCSPNRSKARSKVADTARTVSSWRSTSRNSAIPKVSRVKSTAW